MKIDHPEKIRFTSIKANGCLIHFYYEGDYYLVQTGNMEGEQTLTTRFYKGRNKCHVECIRSCYGGYIGTRCGLVENDKEEWVDGYYYRVRVEDYLIRYKGHNRTLSHIDKVNFVEKLIRLGLLEE